MGKLIAVFAVAVFTSQGMSDPVAVAKKSIEQEDAKADAWQAKTDLLAKRYDGKFDKQEVVKVKFGNFCSEWTANPIAAQEKYKGKLVEFVAEIFAIEQSEDAGHFAILRHDTGDIENPRIDVIARILTKPAYAGIKKCYCRGYGVFRVSVGPATRTLRCVVVHVEPSK